MITPPKLKAGDKVAMVATARKVEPAQVELCVKALQAWGLEVVLGQNLWQVDRQFAGTDEQRAADLQSMVDREDISAILFARGGYGTLRILDRVDLKGLKRHPKWLIGFSDLTVLLARCAEEGIESIHGPMGVSWDGHTANPTAIEHLRKLLMEPGTATYSCIPQRPDLLRTGSAEGRLIGGNLSLLSQLMGTPTDFDTQGCILFLEDLDEYLYHLDRMMVHLRRGGKLEKLAGLVLGGFTELKDNPTPFGKTAEEIIADAVRGYQYPVVFGFPVGHWPENYPLPVGRKATLGVSHTKAELKFSL